MCWKWMLFLFSVLLSSSLANAQNVRIGVLGIFHPRQLDLTSGNVDAIVVFTLTPIKLAVSASWATARMLRPTLLLVTRKLTHTNRMSVTMSRTTSNAEIGAPSTFHEKLVVMG